MAPATTMIAMLEPRVEISISLGRGLIAADQSAGPISTLIGE